MQTSHRARDLDRLHTGSRQRGHAPQISISDDNHHVTEAIGGMYGDEDDFTHQPQRHARPLSFVPSPLGDTIQQNNNGFMSEELSFRQRPGMLRTPSHEKRGPILGSPDSYGSPTSPIGSSGSRIGGSMNGHGSPPSSGGASPTSLNRSPSEASQHFPITDLDSSAAVAQELSNLQAMRRMSMDVHHAADPDLPSFRNIPTVAPAHDADEQDPGRMFWVPASVHPELAPKAFETFIQDKVKTIKRSSLSSESSLSPASADGGGGLRRKKSMLSRQVNDGSEYRDGAERLERKRSSIIKEQSNLPSLQELEDLAQDPSSLVRRLSIEGSRSSLEAASDAAEGGDMPILPPKPPGQTLKRSTRTTYRRGSQRKGDRLASRRPTRGSHDADSDEPPLPSLPKPDEIPQLPNFSSDLGNFDSNGFGGLQRVQTEPTPRPKAVENFSRPGRKAQSPQLNQDDFEYTDHRPTSPEDRKSPSPDAHMFPPRSSSAARPQPVQHSPIPSIVETPPPAQDHGWAQSQQQMQRAERNPALDQPPPSQPPTGPLPGRPGRPSLTRPASLQQTRNQQSQPQPKQTLEQVAANPQSLPGQNTRTDALSIIPTYAEDKKADKKGKEKKDDGTRKSSWSWLTGSEDKDKDSGKKNKQKAQRPGDRSHDDTRLDVLQTSIDGGRPRESLVLDRSSIQVEQPKQASRKPSNEGKKEKDGSLFSSLFGGSKKKSGHDKDQSPSGKKVNSSLRGVSPEPPQRKLTPDVDYNWSRFSILEERAIYRMAHIKLANPRRELYSQVLLSNFMYSYLAKVQQMHPQMQIPQSAAQKKQQERQRKAQEQQQRERELQQQREQQAAQGEEFAQYQRYQEQQARHDSSPANGNHHAPSASANSSRQHHQQQQDDVDQQYWNQYAQTGHANGNGSASISSASSGSRQKSHWME